MSGWRSRYCVLVSRDDEIVAVGSFSTEELARAYAAALPPDQVRGLARLASTDMFRVATGLGFAARRRSAVAR